jgi:hypothetical protein
MNKPRQHTSNVTEEDSAAPDIIIFLTGWPKITGLTKVNTFWASVFTFPNGMSYIKH